jgi:CDP-diacylglycerol--glycerol-3-phosphate 3-phosphatidyltransferase
MNLPNLLTLFRIFLIPLLVVVLMTKVPSREFIGVAIFLAAAITDWLDGYLARKRKQVTALGIWLDPIADKLLVAAAYLALVERQMAPAWMVLIILGRELAVTGLRNIALLQGFTVAVSDLGKVKMGMQVFSITAIILGERFPLFATLGYWALWIVVFFSILSAVQYMREYRRLAGLPVKRRPIREALMSLARSTMKRRQDATTRQ